MKRFMGILLSGALLVSSVPMHSLAVSNDVMGLATPTMQAEVPSKISAEPTNQGLENVIKVVKAKITIPADYTEFNYYFNNSNYYSNSYWSLTWRNPNTSSYIQVNCDTENHITYYSKYDYSNKQAGIASYLKKELKAKADEFIKKIAPDVMSKLQYKEASYEGIYSGNYIYLYERIHNGIALPDNQVSVWVNSVTGEVTAASLNWLYDVTLPSSDTKLTKEEAAKLIRENMKMKLVYRSDYYNIYRDFKGNTSKKAYLVYEPSVGYISIDAKTGKVYLNKEEYINTSVNEAAKDSAATETANGSAYLSLTEQEIAKIEDLKTIISKTDAIKKITSNSYLLIDKNLKVNSATLNKWDDSKGETSYVWNINFNDPRVLDNTKSSDYYRAYAYATVDAKNGNILSFYTSVKNGYDESTQKWKTLKIAYDKKESRKILEKFLSSQVKSKFNNSIFATETEDYIAYYKKDLPVYGGYSYQYNRANEGVEYPYNSLYGSVDGVTGKIYSFGFNWDEEIVFESTKGAMTPDKAMEHYLSKDGFGLKYEINVINKYSTDEKNTKNYDDSGYNVEYEVRLVYRPDINPSYISPFTGDQLSYNGDVYTKAKPYEYKDIAETKENRDILLLSDMNIGFEGENFLPNNEITLGEINVLLQKIGYGYLEETAGQNQKITREEIAQTFITKLGLDKLSKLEGIYKTGYIDENNINSKYLGAVAIAKGMGLISGDANNYFNPKNNVSRMDAVKLIMNFINAQSASIYN
jgi:hypothetical protein